MKVHHVLVAALLVHKCSAIAKQRRSLTTAFGPKRCVAISRSSKSTCVISTNCEGADISKTEFAFNCVGQDGTENIVRHSFGVGGFDVNEEFDTEVKCDSCEVASPIEIQEQPPEPVAKARILPKPPAPKRRKKPKTEVQPGLISTAVVIKGRSQQQRTSKASDSVAWWPSSSQSESRPKAATVSDSVRYGPNGCVSTYKNQVGHCILQTNCEQSAISNYEFGLVCVDKTGSPVRHLFGKDSFDPQETFDTLITCDQCLGLEDIPDEVALNGEVITMSRDISRLKGMMEDITRSVKKLNAEVFPAKPVKFAVAPTYSLARNTVTRKRQTQQTLLAPPARKFNLRRSPPKQVARQDETEEDNDSDDDSEESRPNSCVLVSRSAAGSCVLSTDCEEGAVAKTEFAFNCISQDDLVRHSYGMGGFDRNEHFDTQVMCDRCEQAPDETPAQPAPHKRLAKAQDDTESNSDGSEEVPVDVMDKQGHKVQSQSDEELPVQIVDASGHVVQNDVTEKATAMNSKTHTTRRHMNVNKNEDAPVQKTSVLGNRNEDDQASHSSSSASEDTSMEVVTPENELQGGAVGGSGDEVPVQIDGASDHEDLGQKSAGNADQVPVQAQDAEAQGSNEDDEVPVQVVNAPGQDQGSEDTPVKVVDAPRQESSNLQTEEADDDSDDGS